MLILKFHWLRYTTAITEWVAVNCPIIKQTLLIEIMCKNFGLTLKSLTSPG